MFGCAMLEGIFGPGEVTPEYAFALGQRLGRRCHYISTRLRVMAWASAKDWKSLREWLLMRNQDMARYADALIAITTGSRGTRDMIGRARARNMPVIVIEIPGERPADYTALSPEKQWEADKQLGILDRDGR